MLRRRVRPLTSSTRLKPPIPRVQMVVKSLKDTLEKKSASACSLNQVRGLLIIKFSFNLWGNATPLLVSSVIVRDNGLFLAGTINLSLDSLGLDLVAFTLRVFDIIQSSNQLLERSGLSTDREHKKKLSECKSKAFPSVLKRTFTVKEGNKDPLSLSVDDQACDVPHGCVASCAHVLPADDAEKTAEVKRRDWSK